MELVLSQQELEFLEQILAERERSLEREIAHTDRREFKLALRSDQKQIELLLSRLRGSAVSRAS